MSKQSKIDSIGQLLKECDDATVDAVLSVICKLTRKDSACASGRILAFLNNLFS